MPLNTVEEKTSVSKVQKKVGYYCFRIDGYSGLSTRIGDSVESPEFNLCGHTWQLRIFPGGSLDVHKGFVSFYLASKCNKTARASYRLSIINQIPGGDDETFCSSGIRIFEAKGDQVRHVQSTFPFYTVNTLFIFYPRLMVGVATNLFLSIC